MEEDGDWRTRRSVDELLRQYAGTRNAALRERIVALHLPLVTTLAAQFAARNRCPAHDLMEAGLSGLAAAIERFDPGGEEHFSTFAARMVLRRFEQQRGSE
jgi:DNA-directed RNA polymerase specialized sigma subunit